jgi:hypothetical protein
MPSHTRIDYKMLPHNIQFNTINLPVTDSSLRNQMVQMARFRNLVGDEENPRCVCTIAGYDLDPRELWEIPEVQDLCKRLVAIGYISLLDTMPNIDLPGCPAIPVEYGRPWGAWEVWTVACGLQRGQDIDLQVYGLEFLKALRTSNAAHMRAFPDDRGFPEIVLPGE